MWHDGFYVSIEKVDERHIQESSTKEQEFTNLANCFQRSITKQHKFVSLEFQGPVPCRGVARFAHKYSRFARNIWRHTEHTNTDTALCKKIKFDYLI